MIRLFMFFDNQIAGVTKRGENSLHKTEETKKMESAKNEDQLKLFENGISGGARAWNVQDVAKYLGVSVGHIYNLKAKNKIPYRKRGKLLRFLPNEILDWLNEGGI